MTTLEKLIGPSDVRRMDVALRNSDDPDVQVGALLYTPLGFPDVPYMGWNRWPRRNIYPRANHPIPNEPRSIPPRLHAEETVMLAVYAAQDTPTGGRMILSWFPCAHCASVIIEAGVSSLVAQRVDFSHGKWGASWEIATEALEDAGVELILYDTHGLQDGRS